MTKFDKSDLIRIKSSSPSFLMIAEQYGTCDDCLQVGHHPVQVVWSPRPRGELHSLNREEDLYKLSQTGQMSDQLSSRVLYIFNVHLSIQVFCWMDKWHGMTMDDIRALEEQTKLELDEERAKVSQESIS